VIDAKAALFNVSNYFIAIDQQARTTLRNAFGNVSLDEALSSVSRSNAAMQQQMSRSPTSGASGSPDRDRRHQPSRPDPPGMALQKQPTGEAARILQSRPAAAGDQHRRGQPAGGDQAGEGERQAPSSGPRLPQAAILEAEGRALAISNVYESIKKAEPDPTWSPSSSWTP